MFPVILSWLLLFLLITSIGSLFSFFLKSHFTFAQKLTEDIFDLFWLGLFFVLLIFEIWNFFAPLDGKSLLFLFIAGLAGLPGLLRPSLLSSHGKSSASSWSVSQGFLFLSLFSFVLYFTSGGLAVSTWSGYAYDTDLYHFNWIQWANEYPLIPGLANLHSRLGGQSGFFLFAAVIDNGFWEGAAAWIVNGLLLMVVCSQWLYHLLDRFAVQNSSIKIYCLLTSFFLIDLAMASKPSLYYDNPSLLLQLVLMLELLRVRSLVLQSSSAQTGGLLRSLLIIPVLAALSFSFKPIGAFALAIVGGLMLFVFLRWYRLAEPRKMLILSALLVAIFLAGHLGRNIIASGWLLYPAPIGETSFEWTVPKEPLEKGFWAEMQSVDGQYQVIKAWGRMPGQNFHKAIDKEFGFWFPSWWDTFKMTVAAKLLAAGLVFSVLALFFSLYRYGLTKRIFYDIFLLALAMGNICFWFVGAPNLRFGIGFFWIFYGLAVCLAFPAASYNRKAARMTLLAAVVFLATILPYNYKLPNVQSFWSLGRVTVGNKATKQIQIYNNQQPPLRVYYPELGDQCGNSKIPCTPYPLKFLEERTPGVVQDGYLYKRQ